MLHQQNPSCYFTAYLDDIDEDEESTICLPVHITNPHNNTTIEKNALIDTGYSGNIMMDFKTSETLQFDEGYKFSKNVAKGVNGVSDMMVNQDGQLNISFPVICENQPHVIKKFQKQVRGFDIIKDGSYEVILGLMFLQEFRLDIKLNTGHIKGVRDEKTLWRYLENTETETWLEEIPDRYSHKVELEIIEELEENL